MHRLFYALILLFLSFSSYAAEVNNLYQATAPVTTQQQKERDALAPDLLKQVLIKLVGNENQLSQANIAPVLANATQLVERYEYIRNNIEAADLTQPDQLSLRLSFDKNAVNAVIRQLDLPRWGKVRPDVLVWLATDIDGQQSLQGLENIPQDVFKPLQQAADERGLPILMPLMDLQDQSALSFDNVWSGNDDAINAASQRYGADIILIIKMTIHNDTSQIIWQSGTGDMRQRWTSEGFISASINKGLGVLVDSLASEYAQHNQVSDTNKTLSVQIDEVNDYADFSRIMAYLNQIDSIDNIRVNNLGMHILDLDISYSGDMQVLQRLLSVGGLLSELSEPEGTITDKKYYRLTH